MEKDTSRPSRSRRKVIPLFTRITISVCVILAFFFSTAQAKGKDYYRILGVNRKAKGPEVKRAFRIKSKTLHPDRNQDDPKAQEKFAELANAYEVISDPEKRRIYDQVGEEGLKQQQQGGGGGGSPFQDPSFVFREAFGQGGAHFHFGGGGFPFGGGQQRQQPRQQKASENLFDETDVLQLGENNFRDTVQNREWVMLVQFYAPWCAHCKSGKDEYRRLAMNLKDLLPVAAVNCEKSKQTCEQNNISSYPTIVLYTYTTDKNKAPEKFSGKKDASSITHWINTKTPSNITMLTTESALTGFLDEHPELPKVILFTERKAVSLLFKAIVREFTIPPRLAFGVVVKADTAVVSKFNSPKFPAILYVTDADKFTGDWIEPSKRKQPLSDSLNSLRKKYHGAQGRYGASAGRARELTKRLMTQGECTPEDSKICVILFQYGTTKDEKALAGLKEAAEAMSRDPINFVWVHAPSQPDFVSVFGIPKNCSPDGNAPGNEEEDEEDEATERCPVVIAYKPKRKKYKIMRSSEFSKSTITGFVEPFIYGSTLPLRVKTVPVMRDAPAKATGASRGGEL